MEFVSLTTEGKIYLTLLHGRHTYSELKFETELSDRWLTHKLRELEANAIIERIGKWYSLKKKKPVHPYELSLYMLIQAKRIGKEFDKFQYIRLIVLFGGVAKNTAHEYSDLDMIFVVGDSKEYIKEEIFDKISDIPLRFHVLIDPVIFDEDNFLSNVHSSEGGLIYRIAEGFEVLVDKTNGHLTRILLNRIKEIKRKYEYLKDEQIWLKIK